jgi:hypothetical protein
LLRILTISGSLRAASTNSALLNALARNAPAGIGLNAYVGLGLLPIFNPDDEEERTPAEASRLIEAVGGTDGVIVSSPEYAHGHDHCLGRSEDIAKVLDRQGKSQPEHDDDERKRKEQRED